MFKVFYERGEQLSSARRLLDDETETVAALALVSIHSAIAFNDALLVRLTGDHSKTENHKNAARSTEQECRKKNLDTTGITQLKKLIDKKTSYSYGDAAVTSEEARIMSIAAERFQAWVDKTLKGL